MGKRLVAGILLFLLFTIIIFSLSSKTLSLDLEIYYPGELSYDGYSIENNIVVLRFHSINHSEEIKAQLGHYEVKCILCDLNNLKSAVEIDGERIYPTCEGIIGVPLKKRGIISKIFSREQRSKYYIAGPYNMSELARVWIPQGYSFKGLKIENNTLIIQLSPDENGGKFRIIRSEIIAKYHFKIETGRLKVFYKYENKTWEAKVYSMGKGECPLFIGTLW